MPRIKKFAETLNQNLTDYSVFEIDTNINSQYFRITEFKDTFTGGKNGFLIEGSEHLKETTEIKIQILDVDGNPVYYEPGDGLPEYYEGLSKVVAVYVYEDVPIGRARITLLGELKTYVDESNITRDIPEEWRGIYNVKWEREFTLNPLIRNEDRVRFYRRPKVSITEIPKVVFSNEVVQITQEGTASGRPIIPLAGQDLTEFTLPTSYLIETDNSSSWTGSVVGSTIEFQSGSTLYSSLITDIINDTDIIVETPYTINDVVSVLPPSPYSVTFDYIEGVEDIESAITASFAKIRISDLTTFVGDVARVKIFSKSRSNFENFKFLEEFQIESNELLVDLDTQNKPQEFYGFFNNDIIDNYWITSSNSASVEFNQTYLYNSARLSGSSFDFYTSKSIELVENSEYTLNFSTRIDSNVKQGDYLIGYISGSRLIGDGNTRIGVEQTIVELGRDNQYLQKTEITENFISEKFDDAKLYFDVKGDGWHISDVSLRASQETSFSPDELTIIVPINRTLDVETFDFRFEFYDINNNYIPVRVIASQTFTGGNLNLLRKRIELIPSSLYFQFDSGSDTDKGKPLPPTTIFVNVVTNFITEPITFTSAAYDINGDLIPEYRYYGNDIEPLTYNEIQNNRFNVSIEYEDYSLSNRFRVLSGSDTYFIDNISGSNAITSSNNHIELHITASKDLDRLSEHSLYVLSQSSYITLLQASSSGFIDGIKTGSFASVDDDINYSAIFTTSSITSSLDVYLISSSNDIVDSIKLFDITDGLGGIVYESSDLRSFNLIDYGNGQLNKENFSINYKVYNDSINYLSASIELSTSQSLEEINHVSYSFDSESDSIIFYVDDGATQQYPGLLEQLGENSYRLRVENFTGSKDNILVQYVEITGEAEGVSDSFIATRIQDGKAGGGYDIRAFNGTIIRNSNASSSLEIQAIRIDGPNEIFLSNTTNPSYLRDVKLHVLSESKYIPLSEASSSEFVKNLQPGLTGSGDIDYNAIFDRNSIDSERIVYLIPSSSLNPSGSILKTINLLDILDGLDAGIILFDTDTFTINPYRGQTEFTPPSGSATGSFYKRGTSISPISASIDIFPSMSINQDFNPEFFIYYTTGSIDEKISVRAWDVNGNEIESGYPPNYYIPIDSQSKQLLVEFTYTEEFTSASVSVDKVFTIIPDGKPGDDPIIFEIVPSNIVLNANPKGIVSDYKPSEVDIKLKQGARYLLFTSSRVPGTFHAAQSSIISQNITPGNIHYFEEWTSSLFLSQSSNMTQLSASIEIPLEIHPYFTSSFYTQSANINFTKTLDGKPNIEVIISPVAGFVNSTAEGVVNNYESLDTEIILKEGDDYLNYTSSNVGKNIGFWTFDTNQVRNIDIDFIASNETDEYTSSIVNFTNFNPDSALTSSVTYHITAYPFSLGPGHTQLSSSLQRTQFHYKNTRGTSAKAVKLLASSEVVTFDSDGLILSPTGDIRLTATPVNTTGSIIGYQFKKDGISQTPIMENVNFYDIPSGDTVSPGSVAVWSVEIRDGNTNSAEPVTAFDSVSITGIQEGNVPYFSFLTNDSTSPVYRVSGEFELEGTDTQVIAQKGGEFLEHVQVYSPKDTNYLGIEIGSIGEYQVTIHSVSDHITLQSGLVSQSILPNITEGDFTFALMPGIAAWSNPEQNATGKVVYRVDFENGRARTFKTQSFSIQFEGNTGPGIVFRGVWTGSIDYLGSYENGDRRDAVIWPDPEIEGATYYWAAESGSGPNTYASGSDYVRNILNDWADGVSYNEGDFVKYSGDGWKAITTHTSDVAGDDTDGPPGTGPWFSYPKVGPQEPNTGSGMPPSPEDAYNDGYWKYLGEEDLFVAAKFAIFEESFVKNTINVGNIFPSEFAQIAIVGGRTDPYISIGQSTTAGFGSSGFYPGVIGYDRPGIFLGIYEDGGNGTSGRFSIKSRGGSGTRGLFWDGDTLTIQGAIRQLNDGSNEGRSLGTWGAGFSYLENDEVRYSSDFWKATINHTSALGNASTNGTPGAGPWLKVGGGDRYSTTSTTTLTIGTGTQTLTVGGGLAWLPGTPIVIAYDGSNYMVGTVTTYDSSSGAMEVNINTIVGSGTYSNWNVSLAGTQGDSGTSGTSGAGTSGTSGANGTGSIGPGVVYRGEFEEGVEYYRTDERADIVLWTDNSYYICILTHTDRGTWDYATAYFVDDVVYYAGAPPDEGWYICIQNAPSSTIDLDNTSYWTYLGTSDLGPSENSLWEAFGAEFTSVATDILLAQDATITKGLVIGEFPSTGDAFIRTTQAYTPSSGSGFYLEDSGKFFYGNTSGSYIRWNGSNLIVNGEIQTNVGNIGAWQLVDGGETLASSNSNILLKGAEEEIDIIDTGGNVKFRINTDTSLPPISSNTGQLNALPMSPFSHSIEYTPSGPFDIVDETYYSTQSFGTFTVGEAGSYIFTQNFDGGVTYQLGEGQLARGSDASSILEVQMFVVESPYFRATGAGGQTDKGFRGFAQTSGSSIVLTTQADGGEIFLDPNYFPETSYVDNSLLLVPGEIKSGLLSAIAPLETGKTYEVVNRFKLRLLAVPGTGAVNEPYSLGASAEIQMSSTANPFATASYNSTPSYTIVNGGGFQSVINAEEYLIVRPKNIAGFVRGSVTVKGGIEMATNVTTGSGHIHFYPMQNTGATQWLMYNDEGTFYLATGEFPLGSQKFTFETDGDLIIAGNNATKASGTAWINPSDVRIKENITPISNALTKIKSLNPIKYNFKEKYINDLNLKISSSKYHHGYIAHEFEEVFPNEVIETKQIYEGDFVKGIDTGILNVYAIKAIQEISDTIDGLNERIKLLESEISQSKNL